MSEAKVFVAVLMLRRSTTPKSKLGDGTPVKKPITPSKELTPLPTRPTTPGKTPSSKNAVMRTSSPRRVFKDENKVASTPQSFTPNKKATPNELFQKDKETGAATPSFVLTPQRRVSSGIGIDKEGLGSPRVTALLDRRGSIGDYARSSVPSSPNETGRRVRFDDPRAMEEEIEKEQEREEDFERGGRVLERETAQLDEEKDATLNLKEMIQSLTPKKPLKGRKSLHVGAAKGILGKRPIELDEDDDEDSGGVKRLKGHQASPVKHVKLQGPPSKDETTGRLTRAARKSMENASNVSSNLTSTSSPIKAMDTSSRQQGRFKDAEAYALGQETGPLMEKDLPEDSQLSEEIFGGDRIQLQDFLNMTSIRFMELTTTKRRHTIAPKAPDSRENKQEESEVSLEDCVAAGAATIPMLELFQHVS